MQAPNVRHAIINWFLHGCPAKFPRSCRAFCPKAIALSGQMGRRRPWALRDGLHSIWAQGRMWAVATARWRLASALCRASSHEKGGNRNEVLSETKLVSLHHALKILTGRTTWCMKWKAKCSLCMTKLTCGTLRATSSLPACEGFQPARSALCRYGQRPFV